MASNWVVHPARLRAQVRSRRGWLRHARIAVPTDATADRIVLESDHNKELLAYATSALSQGALRIRDGWDCVPHGSPKSF